jgi:hypothetical protein
MWRIFFDPQDGEQTQGSATIEDGSSDGGNSSGKTETKPETFQYQDRELSRNEASMVATFLAGSGQPVPDDLVAFRDGSVKPVKPSETTADLQAGNNDASVQTGNKPETGTVEQSGVKPTSESGTDQSQVKPEELAKARQALKSWQYSDDLINQMSNEEILKRGKKAAESQSNASRRISETDNANQKLLDEIASLRALVESSQNTVKPEEQGDSGDNASRGLLPESMQQDSVHSDLVGYLEPILKQHEQVLKDQQRLIEGQQSDFAKRLEEQRLQNDEVLIEIARRDLAAEFPQLRDDANFKAVKKKIYELAELEGYHDEDGNPFVDTLMTDASRIVLGQQKAQQQQRDLTTRFTEQTGGQPDDANDSTDDTVEGQPMDNNQKMLYAHKLLIEGKTPDQIRSVLAKIPSA